MSVTETPSVLALFVSRHGLAFAFHLAPTELYDWGVKHTLGTDKNAEVLTHAKALVARFNPDVLVIENVHARRHERVKELARSMIRIIRRSAVPFFQYSRDDIRAATGTKTKHELNHVLGDCIPALAHRIPAKLRAWETESAIQGVFDAVSLAVTHFIREHGFSTRNA